MSSIEPTSEAMRSLIASAEDAGGSDRPIMMINLLRFADQASYPDDFEAEPCSGAEAYGRYAAALGSFLDRLGGSMLWAAPAHEVVIGPTGEDWDMAFGVRYPSRKAFVQMVTDPEYLEAVPHRTAALSDSRLILCDEPGEGAAIPLGLG